MFKLLYTYIKSLFTSTDITLTLNGSQLTFTKEGDVKLTVSRNLNMQAKHIFENCSDAAIKEILFSENKEIKLTYSFTPESSLAINKEELCLEQLD
jgi:hypothetical protein